MKSFGGGLDHPDVDQGVRKSTFLLKLFFRRDTSYQIAIDQLLARFSQLEQTLAQYEQIEKEIKGRGRLAFPLFGTAVRPGES